MSMAYIRPDETFKVDAATADRVKRLAKEMQCGWRDVIRMGVDAGL